MFIKKLQLQNFKRFTDLTIDLSSLVVAPKLVLLIGTNGCGKSSIFDAFEFISKQVKGVHPLIEGDYYKKDAAHDPIGILLEDGDTNTISYINNQYKGIQNIKKNSFYGRSAFRYTPVLKKTSLGTNNIDIANDTDRPLRYIDTDEHRFENDIEMELQKMIESIQGINFDDEENRGKTSYFDIMHQTIIQPMNESLSKIFANEGLGIRMVGLTPPGGKKKTDMIFRKGNTKKIKYDYLSAGEKEIINILFDIYVKRSHYNDTVYFLDELDSHLNTSLQYLLIEEIIRILPDSCQLWTATHSLGFIDFAQSNEQSVIIDFNEKNFDQKQLLTPNKKSYSNIVTIAIPKDIVSKMFIGKKIVYCENTDSKHYNALGLDNFLFSNEIDKHTIFSRIEQKGPSTELGLIDRDYITNFERETLMSKIPGLKILEYYCLENYLYHPDNISELLSNFPKDEYKQSLCENKNNNLVVLGGKLANGRKSMNFLKHQKGYFSQNEIEKGENELQLLLKSDNFDEFYPIFSMKSYDKSFLSPYNIDPSKLATTKRLKEKIEKILQR